MDLTLNEQLLATPESVPGLMSALFDNVEDGIIVGDLTGRVIFSNNAAKRINDDSTIPEDPEARVLRYTVKVGDSELPMEVHDLPLLKVLREGEIKNHPIFLMSSKGEKKTLSCDGRVLRDESGRKIGAILALHDRTRLHRVEQHEAELAQERNELLLINSELERFSSIAAHDLKSPLNTITQFAEVLKDDFGQALGEEGIEIVQRMIRAGSRLRNLIDDLLTYARSGKTLGDMTVFEPTEVVNDVLISLQGEVRKRSAIIEVDPLPLVFADKTGVSQIFQNVIANALKYSRDEIPRIQISGVDQGETVLFVVKDNGIGIRPEDIKSAFELFKRVDGSEKSEGTGLGLPICKRIIEFHGGSIWLESEVGRGTAIFFNLPKPPQSAISFSRFRTEWN